MEWREQSAVSCEEAYSEAQRWIEAVTKKKFGSNDFRSALENGVLLCDLINKIKPGIVRKINRLPTPIAGLDNLNVFLKACGKLGLKEAQLFHPGDLQDLSSRVTVKDQETSRRLKNVLITIFWLGRRAQSDRFYDGPYLNFKAFEGLLGTALYKALQESSSQKGSNVRDSGFGESWYSEREELHHLREEEEEEEAGGGHRRDDSLDSLDSLGSRPHSISSDTTLKGSSEGCCSDTEVDSVFKMAENKDSASYRRSLSLTPKTSAPFNQFLPTKDKQSGYVPAPLRKKRAERNEDNRRSWGSTSYTEEEGTLTRQLQTQDSFDGSKSTSDILSDQAAIRQARYEELQKYRERVKESEDQWQDDLSKWKNRRRSVNSDIVKKKEERERIEEITSSSRRSKTFKEMQEERETKSRTVGSRFKSSFSYLDDKEDVFEKPLTSPRTRSFPARSYTIDTPYSSSEAALREDPPAASPATGRAASPPRSQEVDFVDGPAGSDSTTITTTRTFTSNITPRSVHRSRSPSPEPAPPPRNPISEYSSTVKTEETTTIFSSSSFTPKVPEPRRPFLVPQTAVEAPSSVSLLRQQPQISSMEPKPPGVSRVSASLPRSYQKPDTTRITSVVTPRPFGAQSSRITSLPRAFTTDETQKRVNGNVDVSKKSSVPSRYHQYMTSEDEAHSESSSSHSSEDEEEEETLAAPKSLTSTQSVSPVPPQVKSLSAVVPPFRSEAPVSPTPAKENRQENFCEMRISLNQKPNSSRDFGFQAAWDSTGARVTSIQPGSPAEMCQLQVGDEVVAVNMHQVADMSYVDWKSSMEDALQEGSLVMDIRRHGKNSTPDTVIVSPSLDLTSRFSPEKLPSKEALAHSAADVASNGVNGGFREESVTMRNKDSEPISLKNLKRRSEFFEQGGSDSVMPDIPVPAITPSSNRWSWDPEEERKRQEKWQKEQERLLQEKYKRDQEKLQEEWLKAQEEAKKSGEQYQSISLGVNSPSIGPRSPLSAASHAVYPSWEDEERMRKEEQERQRQAEERRKREEEELELQRLQEERKRREQQEEEERMRREEEELRWQRRKEEEQERRRQELLEQQRREQERALELQRQQQQQQWAKSKSSPQLDEEDKPQRRVTGSGVFEKRGQQPSSQAELERQQILNEMKKKTPLLTDSSWIRQRAPLAPVSRDPDLPPMRRGESLDHLNSSYNSWRSSWTPRNSSSIPNYTRPHSALSGSTNSYQNWSGLQRSGSSTLPSSHSLGSLRGGAGTPSSPWGRQTPSPSFSSPSPTTSPEPTYDGGASQQRSRSVSGKKICTFCDTPLGKGAAMIIESLGLCYHLSCFKCIDCKSDLGGSEAGAEVRIRNKQLYCNSCYIRFKSGQPTAM